MKKALVVTISLILILILCNNIYDNNKEDVFYASSFEYLDIEGISDDIDYPPTQMLKNSYFENYDNAVFSPYSMNVKSSLQMCSDVFQIASITNYSNETLINEFINTYHSIDFVEYEDELLNYSLYSKVHSYLNIVDKKIYNEILIKHYDEESHLFFGVDKEESLENKIIATSRAIEIVDDLQLDFYEIDKVKNKLIELYGNDDFFTKENALETIFKNGGLIIRSLNKLGVDLEQLDDYKKRVEWVKYWIEEAEKVEDFDLVSLFVIIDVNNISSAYGLTYESVNDNFINFIQESEGFYQTVLKNSESYHVDSQNLLSLLEVCKIYNIDFLYERELTDFIETSIKSQLKRYYDFIPNIIDNYYGLALANNFKLEYDIEKVNNTLNSWLSYYEESSYNIDSHTKLMTIYYLVLSLEMQEIELNENQRKIILKDINNYLETDLVESDIRTAMYDLRLIVELNKILESDYNYTQNTKKIIEKYIYDENLYNDISMMCDFITVIDYLELERNYTSSIKRIMERINNIHVRSFDEVKIDDLGIRMSYDTVTMNRYFKLKNALGILDNDECKSFHDYIGLDNLYVLEKEDSEKDFRYLYYNYQIMSLYLSDIE